MFSSSPSALIGSSSSASPPESVVPLLLRLLCTSSLNWWGKFTDIRLHDGLVPDMHISHEDGQPLVPHPRLQTRDTKLAVVRIACGESSHRNWMKEGRGSGGVPQALDINNTCSCGSFTACAQKAPQLGGARRGVRMGPRGTPRSPASLARFVVFLALSQASVVTARLVPARNTRTAAFLPQQYRLDLHARSRPQWAGKGLYSGESESPFEGGWLSRVRGGGGGGGGTGGGGGMGGPPGGGRGKGKGGGNNEDNNDGNALAGVVGAMGSLWQQYSILLQDKPLTTKALTAGFIAIVGDLVAQVSIEGLYLLPLPTKRLIRMCCLCAVNREGLVLPEIL